MTGSIEHFFNIIDPTTGRIDETSFTFDRATTRREARRIVTQVEGHKIARATPTSGGDSHE